MSNGPWARNAKTCSSARSTSMSNITSRPARRPPSRAELPGSRRSVSRSPTRKGKGVAASLATAAGRAGWPHAMLLRTGDQPLGCPPGQHGVLRGDPVAQAEGWEWGTEYTVLARFNETVTFREMRETERLRNWDAIARKLWREGLMAGAARLLGGPRQTAREPKPKKRVRPSSATCGRGRIGSTDPVELSTTVDIVMATARVRAHSCRCCQSVLAAGTIHSQRCRVTDAMRSKSAS